MSAPLAEQIYTAVKPLPERYMQEVLDFVEFLSAKAKVLFPEGKPNVYRMS